MTNPITLWSDAVVRSWAHLADIATRARDGYTPEQSQQDLRECATRATATTTGILSWWIDLLMPDGPLAPTTVARDLSGGWFTPTGGYEVTVDVPSDLAGRQLSCAGFRAHGEGTTTIIPTEKVTITPREVGLQGSTVRVAIEDLSPYAQGYDYVGDLVVDNPGAAAVVLASIRVPWFRSNPVA